jgi:predicted amidophosphoribosyltransferase
MRAEGRIEHEVMADDGGLAGLDARLRIGQKNGRCPRCGVFVHDDYIVCPYCALVLKKECPSCRRHIALNWNACAYCGHVIVPIIPPNDDRLHIEMPSRCEDLPVQAMVNGKVLLRGRCPRCSHLIMDDARYCDSCGLKVEERLLRPLSSENAR